MTVALLWWCAVATAAGTGAGPTNLAVRVDPRVELMSVIFRLAGYPEYNQGRVPSYTADVDQQFGKLRDHAVVQYAKDLRRDQSISFDACMSLAVHLGDADALSLLASPDALGLALDSRWKPESVHRFLEQARDFAKTADFAAFLNAHRQLHESAVDRMDSLLRREARLDWFENYFGPKSGASFHVVVGMLNGGANYGVRFLSPSGTEDLYAIIGVSKVDNAGIPVFTSEVIELFVHEFTHSFVNHVIEKHRSELEAAVSPMYAIVKEAMDAQAYGNWKIMLDELFVRASVIRYVHAFRGESDAEKARLEEEERKFLWIREADGLLAEYERSRETYPTLDAFFPKVVEFFHANGVSLVDGARQKEADLDARRPRLVAMTPANGDTVVDPATETITLTFDRPMQSGYSLMYRGDKDSYPQTIGDPTWDSTRTILSVRVRLAPSKRYRFSLNGDQGGSFRSNDGAALKRVDVEFSTRTP